MVKPSLHGCIVTTVALLGIAASAAVFAFDLASERAAARIDLERHARERVELLRSKISSSAEVLHGIASVFDVWGTVSRGEFARFVAGSLARQPELLALSWTPRVRAAEREHFEAAARSDGVEGFHFVQRDAGGGQVAAVQRPEYFPVYYIAPVLHNEMAIGFDLGSNPVRAKTLDDARDSGQALATPSIVLVQEPRGELGFLVFLPVYRHGAAVTTVADRRAALIGYTTAVYRIPDLVTPAFSGLSDDIDVRIEDRTAGREAIFRRASNAAAGAARSDLAIEAPLDLVGRAWTVVLTPTPHALATHSTFRPWMALLIGLATTGLLTTYLNTIVRRRAVVERRVRERTHALSVEIAERRRAEDQAVLAERRYRAIFENCIEGIFQTTLDGRYISVNPALTRIYGYDRPEDLIRDLSDISGQLYVDPSRRQQFAMEVQRDGVLTHFESQVRRRDGTIIWISENARAVCDAAGELSYYEGTVEDITQRKTAESRLLRLNDELEERVHQRTRELDEANRAKSIFLANVSHEIRTPMNAIVGYAQLLRREEGILPHQREALDTIAAGGDHLLGLIEELIDVSKLETQRTELRVVDLDLHGLLDELELLLRQRAEGRKLTLRFERSIATPCVVRGDEGSLRQVLINLIGNGIKYTDSGGVTARVTAVAGDLYAFEVIDTGIGISSSDVANLFEPFTQGEGGLARGGSGLGLAIARRHVMMMGGELLVESTSGEGSRFHFDVVLPPAETTNTQSIGTTNAISNPNSGAANGSVLSSTDARAEIPADLLDRLLSSADVGSVTDIKSCLNELERHSDEAARLAGELRGMLRRFDMDGIGKILATHAVRVASMAVATGEVL